MGALAALPACGDDGGGNNTGGADASVTPDPPDAGPGQPDADTSGTPDANQNTPDAGGGTGSFKRYTLDGSAAGPAYTTVADLDGDGQSEVIVSHLGTIEGINVVAGAVTIHTRGNGLGDWSKSDLIGLQPGIYFPGHTDVHDIDRDGDLDVIVPSGFLVCAVVPAPFGPGPCGGLAWMEQTPDGWVRHDIVAPTANLFYHQANFVDVDGDGVEDLLTTGEEAGNQFSGTPGKAETVWFKGTDSGDRFETTARKIGDGLGSFPRMIDVDGDGDLDVAGNQFFLPGASFGWFERVAEPSDDSPAGEWTFHVIADDVGPSIQMTFIDDLYGDGVTRAIGANHTNTSSNAQDPESGVFVFDIPADDPTQPWPKQMISTGIVSAPNGFGANMGAPGVFGTGDVDGDGDLDVVVAGDGDPKVYWLEQTAPGIFTTHVLQDDLSQAGGCTIADLDGNGTNEILVTGYEANVVYVYEWQTE